MRRRGLVAPALALAALAAIVTAPANTAAAGRSLGTLKSPHQILRWKGGPFGNPGDLPGFSVPSPELCATNCEQYTLKIALPSSTWTRPRDGVIIAIGHENPDDGINLYVYDPSGTRVGTSDGLDSNGQSVFLQRPKNGTYSVVITVTTLATPQATYVGDVRVRPDPCRVGNCVMLPKLNPVPPYDFHLSGLPAAHSTNLGFRFPFDFGPATSRSCWLDETIAQGAQRCLRFSSRVDNTGDGSLVVRFRLLDPVTNPGVDPQNEYLTGCSMQQLIELDRGSVMTRSAGPCVYHVPHGHFHYQNMARFFLHAVSASGRTGPRVRSSGKVGFCLTDGSAIGFRTTRFSGRQFWFPYCNFPAAVEPNAWVQMGISMGWGDVYTWDVPQQYIEISGIRDGVYDVIAETNPKGEILELGGHRNGRARTRICLKGDTVTVLAANATRCARR
jgi:lysyl oxidase